MFEISGNNSWNYFNDERNFLYQFLHLDLPQKWLVKLETASDNLFTAVWEKCRRIKGQIDTQWYNSYALFSSDISVDELFYSFVLGNMPNWKFICNPYYMIYMLRYAEAHTHTHTHTRTHTHAHTHTHTHTHTHMESTLSSCETCTYELCGFVQIGQWNSNPCSYPAAHKEAPSVSARDAPYETSTPSAAVAIC